MIKFSNISKDPGDVNMPFVDYLYVFRPNSEKIIVKSAKAIFCKTDAVVVGDCVNVFRADDWVIEGNLIFRKSAPNVVFNMFSTFDFAAEDITNDIKKYRESDKDFIKTEKEVLNLKNKLKEVAKEVKRENQGR